MRTAPSLDVCSRLDLCFRQPISSPEHGYIPYIPYLTIYIFIYIDESKRDAFVCRCVCAVDPLFSHSVTDPLVNQMCKLSPYPNLRHTLIHTKACSIGMAIRLIRALQQNSFDFSNTNIRG